MAARNFNSRNLVVHVVVGTLLAIVLIVLIVSLLGLNDNFTLLAPLGALGGICIIFFWALTRRDDRLPIAEVGAFYMLAIVAYGAIPLAWHLLSGMRLTVLSHGRLYALDPTPDDLAWVGWMHVIFALSFGYVYLAVRKQHRSKGTVRFDVSGATWKSLLIMLLLFEGYFWWLKMSTGVNFSTAYDSSLYEQAEAYTQLSLAEKQFVAHPYGMLIAIKIGLIMWLTANWRSRAHRWGLIAVLAFSLLTYLQAPGGRFALISLFLAAALTYHHVVRPIRMATAITYGVLLVVAFFTANIIRGGDASGVQLAAAAGLLGDINALFSISNEFQISYGSVLELQHNLASGVLRDIPWQVYVHDILLVIPQQLLPFDKIDPVQWYVNATDNPDYFNYGVIAESVLGFGVIEVVVRGVAMGAIFAAIHNWWIRRPGRFWPTFFYVWLAIAVYQSFRNTSMHVLPLIVYQWVPVYVLVSLVGVLLRRRGIDYRRTALPHRQNFRIPGDVDAT